MHDFDGGIENEKAIGDHRARGAVECIHPADTGGVGFVEGGALVNVGVGVDFFEPLLMPLCA